MGNPDLSVKAMLHEAIFPATCNATNALLQVANTIARVTPHFCNLQRNIFAALQVARKINYRIYSIKRPQLNFKLGIVDPAFI